MKNRTKTRKVMIENVGPIFLAFFFGFGGHVGNPLENPQGNCKKYTKVTKIKILSFLGLKSKFCNYNPPPPKEPFELFQISKGLVKKLMASPKQAGKILVQKTPKITKKINIYKEMPYKGCF